MGTLTCKNREYNHVQCCQERPAGIWRLASGSMQCKRLCTKKCLAFRSSQHNSRASSAGKHEELASRPQKQLHHKPGKGVRRWGLRWAEGTGWGSPAHCMGVHPKGKACQVLKATVTALVGNNDGLLVGWDLKANGKGKHARSQWGGLGRHAQPNARHVFCWPFLQEVHLQQAHREAAVAAGTGAAWGIWGFMSSALETGLQVYAVANGAGRQEPSGRLAMPSMHQLQLPGRTMVPFLPIFTSKIWRCTMQAVRAHLQDQSGDC